MPTILKNHYALHMELFTTPSVDRFVTFYEAIILWIIVFFLSGTLTGNRT